MFDNNTSRLSRLTAILNLLRSKQLITARSIASKFGISMRTAYRDIKALEEAGVPIMTVDGKGYSLVEGYTIPPIMFSEKEINALITAEQIISKNKDTSLAKHYSEAITKIKAIVKNSVQNKGELLTQRIQIRNNIQRETTSNYLSDIQLAITNRNIIKIEYKSVSADATEREVEALALYSTNDNWILIAYCRLRQEERSFRLDRIGLLQIMNEKFEPREFTFEEYIKRCLQKMELPLP